MKIGQFNQKFDWIDLFLIKFDELIANFDFNEPLNQNQAIIIENSHIILENGWILMENGLI